jgi:hypothetical protein
MPKVLPLWHMLYQLKSPLPPFIKGGNYKGLLSKSLLEKGDLGGFNIGRWNEFMTEAIRSGNAS